jgi:hypothetical protein
MKTPMLVTFRTFGPAAVVASLGASLGLLGCSSASPTPGATPIADAGPDVEDFSPTAATFDCLTRSEWTQVGLSYFKNVLGHTTEMLDVARSPEGGTFPVGTIVQLIPGEASAKRGEGYSKVSHDWEFFSLNVAATGTTIKASGGDAHVVNSFSGSSCLGCHGQAAPQWDLLCGDADGGSTAHGCASLGPLATPTNIMAIQASDPRCP